MTQEALVEPISEDEAIKNQMEKIVPTYDAYMRRVTLGREEALRQATVDLARIQPGDSLLEVGCGTGTLTLAAKRRAGPTGEACGIDIIPGMIEASQRKAAAAGETIDFQEGSIERIPFPMDQFDVVLCSFMIFHMSAGTREKGLAEIRRVLKPSGRLLVLDLSMPAQPLPRLIARTFFKGFVEHDLQELIPGLEAAGFGQIDSGPVHFRVFGLPLLGFVRAAK